jgi:hypothetical protein
MIFLSYRRADTADVAGRIRDRLETNFPKQVFLDVQDIEPGVDFFRKIETTIGSCKVFILLIGKTWLTSTSGRTKLGDEKDVVTLEVLSALRQDVPIIPVLVNGAVMPETAILPPQLQTITRLNTLEIRHADFDYGMSRLVKPIYGLLELLPPTALERMLESWAEKMGYPGFLYGEKQRDVHAFLCLGLGVFSLLFIGVVGAEYYFTDNLPVEIFSAMGMSLIGALPGLIGLNSAKYRTIAVFGMALCGFSFLILFGLFNYEAIVGSEEAIMRQRGILP